jgi:hypothetical protein
LSSFLFGCLTPLPISFETFVVFLKFRFRLTVGYRLSRRYRIESLSISLVDELLLGGSLRFDHLDFAFSPELDQPADGSNLRWNVRIPAAGEKYPFGAHDLHQKLRPRDVVAESLQ